jgi:EAL domain-containing protein (putative c-di-GMP-specific phosphodiesterase class I)
VGAFALLPTAGVIAEDIETEAQRDLLTSVGCDEMQGYLFGAPVPASELLSLLADACRSERIKS